MMSTPCAPVLYQQTRLTPTPLSLSSILQINTNGTSSSHSFFSGVGRKRPFDEISGLDEESYAQKHLASEGSIFFRRKQSAPRSFLWRVLSDRKVLEVQSVDLFSSQSGGKEGWLTYHISFNDKIVRGGVQLADSTENDALDIFVLTEGRELFTITLRRDLLTRETTPVSFDATSCCKKYAPNSFSFRYPYRFVAISSLELLVSLHDGGLMQLTRNAGDHGASWKETFFSEGGWRGTLKGLIPIRRYQTVRYGDLELEPSTAVAIAKSPDGKYIWTMTLDHELRCWNTKTGELQARMDALNEERDLTDKKRAPYLMSADQGVLLQIVPLPSARGREATNEKYCIVLHSPKDHQFKFYAVHTTFSSVEGEQPDVVDIAARGVQLIPPIDELLNTNVWRLEDFYLKPGLNWEDTQLWLRARSGATCKSFMLEFDLEAASDELRKVWSCGWSVVDAGDTSTERLRNLDDYPGLLDGSSDAGITPTERWLDFIFYPGRFSILAIETALNVYRKGRNLPSTAPSRGLSAQVHPVKERLVSAIASKIMLRRLPNETPDYVRHQQDIQTQWRAYYSLLSHLHNRRCEPLSLAFDPEGDMPWIVSADFVAPLRTVGAFSRVILNSDFAADDNVDETLRQKITLGDHEELSGLLLCAAHDFRRSLPMEWQEAFCSAAISQAMEQDDNAASKTDCLKALYENTRLGEEVTEDTFAALESAVGLSSLDSSYFEHALKLLDQQSKDVSKGVNVELYRHGDMLMIAVAQEILHQAQSALFNLLALVAFMANDLEDGDLHEGFHPEQIYEDIMSRLRHHELLLWMAGHARKELLKPKSSPGQTGSLSRESSELALESDLAADSICLTILESICIGDFQGKADPKVAMPDRLTTWAVRWTYGVDLNKDWAGFTAHVMADLLKHQNTDLALNFVKFLTDDPWSTYLLGRLYVLDGSHQSAATCFAEAAEGVSKLKNVASRDTAHLLSAIEKDYFGHGLSKYYEHIVNLFEKAKMPSYVIDFANDALQHIESDSGLSETTIAELDRRRAESNSPAIQKINDSIAETKLLRMFLARDEVLNRLFNACLLTGRFEEAFETIHRFTDPKFRTSNLKTLVAGAIKHDAVPELLSLPWEGDLARQADTALLALAKKQLASDSSAAPAYHQILYAFRTQRGDFRGAAEILFEHLERLKHSNRLYLKDPDDDTLVHVYVLLINTMACCGDGEGWLLADPIPGVSKVDAKRRLVTVQDVRREYDLELDRRSDVLQGRFPLVAGNEGMDVDML